MQISAFKHNSAIGNFIGQSKKPFLIIGFCMGVCNGFAIPIAQEFGAGHENDLRIFVGNCVRLSVASQKSRPL